MIESVRRESQHTHCFPFSFLQNIQEKEAKVKINRNHQKHEMTDPKNVLRAGPEDPNFQHLGKRKDGKDDGDWPAVEPFSFPEIEEGEIKMAGADTKRRKVQRSSALESRDSSSILPCPPAFQKLLSPIPVSISPFSVLAIDVGDDDDEDEDDDDKLSEIKKVRALSLSGNVSNTCDASAYDQDDVHALIPPFINPVLQSIYRDQVRLKLINCFLFTPLALSSCFVQSSHTPLYLSESRNPVSIGRVSNDQDQQILHRNGCTAKPLTFPRISRTF